MSFTIVIILTAIILINAGLWIFLMPWYVDKRISRFQNELVDKHYTEVETMYRKMRGWRHDYHNHIQVLKAHMELDRYDEAKQYLDMLNDDLTTVDTVIKTGNVMVDAILNSKLTMIKEKGIHVDATAIVPQDVPFSGIDLSVLIGNLLDNAMEACMQIKNKDESFIRIYIDIVKKQLYISVANSMNGSAKRRGLLREGDCSTFRQNRDFTALGLFGLTGLHRNTAVLLTGRMRRVYLQRRSCCRL